MTDEIRCKVSCEEDRTRSGPGRIVGRILTYGERATDRPELFERGALSMACRWRRDSESPARKGRAHHARSADAGRRRVAHRPNRCPDTIAGRDAATEIRAGLMRGLSVSFQAARQVFASGVRRIQSATMTGIGLVDDPSYDAPVEVRARVQGRRHRRAWQ